MNTPVTSPEQSCGNCTNWQRLDDKHMSYYGGCAYRAAGHYTPERSACLFDPTCFNKKWSVTKC